MNWGIKLIKNQWRCSCNAMTYDSSKRSFHRQFSTSIRKVDVSPLQKQQFHEDGFLVLPSIISEDVALQLKSRVEPLFHGKFETGVYPDEWHWRPGLSLNDVTREMCKAWKCDRTIASVVTSPELGRLGAALMDWPGARLAQDDIFWKPKAGKEIFYHQDLPYFDFIVPSEVITIWIALTSATAENGSVEYAKGSHKWPTFSNMTEDFHAPQKDYRDSVMRAAKQAGHEGVQLVPVVVPPGGGSVHHGRTWHGSGRNISDGLERMSLVVHLIRSDAQFKPAGVGYIYGRYKIHNSTTMEETFFPIIFSPNGYRSPSLLDYCKV